MPYLEAHDHADIFVPHSRHEQTIHLGEIRLNYTVSGSPDKPALLLIPAQTESWWGYEAAMTLLAEHYQVYAVDLRGQGRSTWTPGRYTLDNFGGDLVRFLDDVVARPAVVSGLSSGGTIAAWLAAFAKPGQIRAAVFEDAPLFASEANPLVGQSIRQGIGPVFAHWHKWLGSQWSIGDWAGMQAAAPTELPPAMVRAVAAMSPAGTAASPAGPPQDLKEYDPEWGQAFVSGSATAGCDHANMLGHVRVPVLFTHHFHAVDGESGALMGAISDEQVAMVEHLVTGAGNTFTYLSFPQMAHSMHGTEPELFASTVHEWISSLAARPERSTVA